MNRLFATLIVAALLVLPAVAQAQDKPAMTDQQKLGYSLGVDIAKNLKQQGIQVDTQSFARGFADAMAGASLALTDQEMKDAIQAFQKDMMAKQQERKKAEGEVNKKTASTFMAENKGKPGVVALSSGLQYKVITEGAGPKPKESDTVTVHYRGTLIDGTEFDSSYSRGEPATFPVNGVIKGWTEALQLMPVGSKWQLFIPSSLGYGERGAAGLIGPNATLIFEVELVSIQEKK